MQWIIHDGGGWVGGWVVVYDVGGVWETCEWGVEGGGNFQSRGRVAVWEEVYTYQ